MIPRRSFRERAEWIKRFSTSVFRRKIVDLRNLPDRIVPKYQETPQSDLLSLQWPSPPQNILIVQKDHAPQVIESSVAYANHIHNNYENVSLIYETGVATEMQDRLSFPIHSTTTTKVLCSKVDLVTTLGGDGTILHASSLFKTSLHVPPILSFSMGSLGFLGEWNFSEYKRAFREVFMSGAAADYESPLFHDQAFLTAQKNNAKILTGWSSIRGKSLGRMRSSKILLRNRVKVGVFDRAGHRYMGNPPVLSDPDDICAMNEVAIHRGNESHLVIIEVFVGGRFLTEAVADGIIIATPTGSTAYSLSSGGSIIHPLVSSILMTPICPRSLSFRPLVLPANTPITLRLSEKNRGRELDVSVDGRMKIRGVGVGMEIHVCANDIVRGSNWIGGVPCVMRGAKSGIDDDDDGWVGGLNGLLKFNHPFGEAV